MSLLVKFESKSPRVKGITFHPTRPWILASLHSGIIQLWDYRMHVLLDKFDEHDGPVRGISFHADQPIFVSGGDDYKIKVWNYKQKRCIFTLLGHLDYIRTTFFHHKYPWIISASDDQTVRIWNWQSRQSIAILTGHNHYVMCAQFHPSEDLVASASLDQTVRIWDITGLRKKQMPGGGAGGPKPPGAAGQADLFGQPDVVVKHVLEGHDRGVNWVAFHHTMPILVSGSDDRQVKMWRYNESKAWEVDACRGHYNNVSSVLFHPNAELILSNSEDKSIRVWDMQKRTSLHVFRHENERFWVMSAHPNLNMFAAGHDNGMIVFKIQRERPPYCVSDNLVFYVKDKTMRRLDLTTGKDQAITKLRAGAAFMQPYFALAFNPAENSFLLTTRSHNREMCTYDLYKVVKEGGEGSDAAVANRSAGIAAVWVARNRFVVLDKNLQISLRDLANKEVRKIEPAYLSKLTVNDLFFAGTGLVLLGNDEGLYLLDIQQKRIIASVKASKVKYVIWSANNENAALISKTTVTLVNRKLEVLHTVTESVRVKTGCWDGAEVFLYTTSNHIKYALTAGDSGIVRTLDVPLYILAIKQTNLFCLNRDAQPVEVPIDPTEYRFKLALINRRIDEVLNTVKSANLVGQSIIGYLEKKGYPEIALHFVKDEKTRFGLALECGNLDVALEAAKAMDDRAVWEALGEAALMHGNHQIVEMAYQRTKDFERLAFLYLVTGNTEKLSKMLRIAEMRKDAHGQFQTALYLGDVNERTKVLRGLGQTSLAYLNAATHGFADDAGSLKQELEAKGQAVPPVDPNARLLAPPPPVYKIEDNWPQLATARGPFDDQLIGLNAGGGGSKPTKQPAASAFAVMGDLDGEEMEVEGGWGEDDEGGDLEFEDGEDAEAGAGDDEEGGWDVEEDLALPDVAESTANDSDFTVPTRGPCVSTLWLTRSRLTGDHVAAASYETAENILKDSIGLLDVVPLEDIFAEAYSRAHTVFLGYPEATNSPLLGPALRNWNEGNPRNRLPAAAFTLRQLADQLQQMYLLTTQGKFTDAIDGLREILFAVPLLVVNTKQEVAEAEQLIEICREYLACLLLETHRKDMPKSTPPTPDQVKRNAELCAYFTHFELQPIHRILTLRTAVNALFKVKQMKTCASMCRRLLDLGPKPEVAAQIRKVLAAAEKDNTDAFELNYDEHNPFVICSKSFTPLYRGNPKTSCPYCGAHYAEGNQGQTCQVCQLSEIGKGTSGIRILEVQGQR
ncbi:unnamed protein product, partial [Mesorhabditis spiculigera]